jgi:hypothetical protein
MKKQKRKRTDVLDEDVPSVHHRSIEEEEKYQGHGFWGNSTTGYIYDKDLKEEKRYKN